MTIDGTCPNDMQLWELEAREISGGYIENLYFKVECYLPNLINEIGFKDLVAKNVHQTRTEVDDFVMIRYEQK